MQFLYFLLAVGNAEKWESLGRKVCATCTALVLQERFANLVSVSHCLVSNCTAIRFYYYLFATQVIDRLSL
jgi:hypothetical protein